MSDEPTSHILRVLDLTLFSRSQRSKFEISPPFDLLCCYLSQKAVIWYDGVSKYPLQKRQVSAISDVKFGHQVA